MSQEKKSVPGTSGRFSSAGNSMKQAKVSIRVHRYAAEFLYTCSLRCRKSRKKVMAQEAKDST